MLKEILHDRTEISKFIDWFKLSNPDPVYYKIDEDLLLLQEVIYYIQEGCNEYYVQPEYITTYIHLLLGNGFHYVNGTTIEDSDYTIKFEGNFLKFDFSFKNEIFSLRIPYNFGGFQLLNDLIFDRLIFVKLIKLLKLDYHNMIAKGELA